MSSIALYVDINYYIKANTGSIWDANVANNYSIQQMFGMNPFLPYPYSRIFSRNITSLSL